MNTKDSAGQVPADLKGVPFLVGERVTLRTIVPADTADFYRWINDPEVNHFLRRGDLPMGWLDEVDWIAKCGRRNERNLVLGIETKGDGFIGTTGLHGIDWINRWATSGSMIGKKEAWGKGYGTDAKMLMLRHAFFRLNLRKVYTNVYAYNERSHRCQLACGYVETGRFKDDVFRDGRYWDLISLECTRETFEAAEAKWKERRKAQLKPKKKARPAAMRLARRVSRGSRHDRADV